MTGPSSITVNSMTGVLDLHVESTALPTATDTDTATDMELVEYLLAL